MTSITIVTDSYYPIIDGVARFVDALGLSLSSADFDITLIVPSISGLRKFDYDSRPFEFIFLPTIPIKIKDYYICLPNRKLKPHIEKTDLIIINSLAMATGYVLFLNRFYNKPVIEFVHTDEREVIHYAGGIPDSLNYMVFRLLKKLTARVDYFAVATNKFRQRTLDYGVNPEQIFEVNFGYTPKPVDDEEYSKYLQKRKLDPDLPTILYLGRLSDEKNIPRIVKVMGKISLETDTQCVIAGSGYKLNWIKKQIREHDYKITLLNRVPDSKLPIVYSMADILFSPSFHESLGFTTVEALSYGVIPAINGDYREDELDPGYCLYLEDITDIGRMIEQLLNLLNDKSRLKRMKGQAEIASNQFSWNRFGKTWITKINQILSDGGN